MFQRTACQLAAVCDVKQLVLETVCLARKSRLLVGVILLQLGQQCILPLPNNFHQTVERRCYLSRNFATKPSDKQKQVIEVIR